MCEKCSWLVCARCRLSTCLDHSWAGATKVVVLKQRVSKGVPSKKKNSAWELFVRVHPHGPEKGYAWAPRMGFGFPWWFHTKRQKSIGFLHPGLVFQQKATTCNCRLWRGEVLPPCLAICPRSGLAAGSIRRAQEAPCP